MVQITQLVILIVFVYNVSAQAEWKDLIAFADAVYEGIRDKWKAETLSIVNRIKRDGAANKDTAAFDMRKSEIISHTIKILNEDKSIIGDKVQALESLSKKLNDLSPSVNKDIQREITKFGDRVKKGRKEIQELGTGYGYAIRIIRIGDLKRILDGPINILGLGSAVFSSLDSEKATGDNLLTRAEQAKDRHDDMVERWTDAAERLNNLEFFVRDVYGVLKGGVKKDFTTFARVLKAKSSFDSEFPTGREATIPQSENRFLKAEQESKDLLDQAFAETIKAIDTDFATMQAQHIVMERKYNGVHLTDALHQDMLSVRHKKAEAEKNKKKTIALFYTEIFDWPTFREKIVVYLRNLAGANEEIEELLRKAPVPPPRPPNPPPPPPVNPPPTETTTKGTGTAGGRILRLEVALSASITAIVMIEQLLHL